MVSLRRNDHNFSIDQKTREFFFDCTVGDARSLTLDEIKTDAKDLLVSVISQYGWEVDSVKSVEIQPNLFDDDVSVRIRGTVDED